MDEIVRQFELALSVVKVRIGEVAGQRRIVVPQDRAQEQRGVAVDRQRETGEMPRVLVIDALGAAGRRAHVAAAVEHPEPVAVLEHEPADVLQRRGGGDGELLVVLGIAVVRDGGAFGLVLHGPLKGWWNEARRPAPEERSVERTGPKRPIPALVGPNRNGTGA